MTVVLSFLQMKAKTCALSTIRGYIMAISGRHNAVVLKGKPHTISHLPSVKTSLSGLERLKGFKRPKAPEWNLEVVLAALAKAPFEPLDKARHKYLTMKAAFLVSPRFMLWMSGPCSSTLRMSPWTHSPRIEQRSTPRFMPTVASCYPHIAQGMTTSHRSCVSGEY